MSSHLMTPVDAYAPTPAQVRAAVATITHHASDTAEARTFCQALGLLPYPVDHPEARNDLGRAVNVGRKR